MTYGTISLNFFVTCKSVEKTMDHSLYESERETFAMSINKEFLVKLNRSSFPNGEIPFYDMGTGIRVSVAISYGLLWLLGTSSNLVVAICIISNRNMRTLFKLLLLNLAIGDIIITAIVVPLLGIWQTFHYPIWPYPVNVCKLLNVASHVGGLASGASLGVISIYRFAMVKYSKRFRVGYAHLAVTVALIWILAFAGSIGAIFKANVVSMVIKGKHQKLCLMLHDSYSAERQELTFRVTIYVLSSAFMIVLYTNIILFLKRQNIPGLHTVEGKVHAGVKRKRQAAYMMAFATVAMVICFFPYMTLVVINIISGKGFYSSVQGIEIFANIIVALNSAINPFIYWAFCSETRAYIKKMFTSGVCGNGSTSERTTKWFLHGRPRLETYSE